MCHWLTGEKGERMWVAMCAGDRRGLHMANNLCGKAHRTAHCENLFARASALFCASSLPKYTWCLIRGFCRLHAPTLLVLSRSCNLSRVCQQAPGHPSGSSFGWYFSPVDNSLPERWGGLCTPTKAHSLTISWMLLTSETGAAASSQVLSTLPGREKVPLGTCPARQEPGACPTYRSMCAAAGTAAARWAVPGRIRSVPAPWWLCARFLEPLKALRAFPTEGVTSPSTAPWPSKTFHAEWPWGRACSGHPGLLATGRAAGLAGAGGAGRGGPGAAGQGQPRLCGALLPSSGRSQRGGPAVPPASAAVPGRSPRPALPELGSCPGTAPPHGAGSSGGRAGPVPWGRAVLREPSSLGWAARQEQSVCPGCREHRSSQLRGERPRTTVPTRSTKSWRAGP